MLNSLRLKHFKTWAYAELEFGQITGLFGTNSSGKSSLIQFLLLLKQTRDATDRRLALHFGDERTRTRLGSFEDAIQGHNIKLELDWRLQWTDPEEISLVNAATGKPFVESDRVAVEATTMLWEEEPLQTRLAYELGNARFEVWDDEADVAVSGIKSFTLKRARGRPAELGAPTKGYQFPDTVRLAYQNADFLADLEVSYELQMDRLFYLGPLREHPRREYPWSGAQPSDVGDRGEYAVEAILAATRRDTRVSVPGKARQQTFEAAVGYWLKRLGLIDSFSARPVAKGTSIYRVMARVRPKGPEAPLTDVGFGVSQILPVIVLLHYVPEGSTVILEQPEIHLHPLAQAELADLLIYVAQSRKVQILLESHSEHLLLRLQRRIAEEEVSANDVRLYFARPEGLVSTLRPLELDPYGNILNWPDKFMGDQFNEVSKAELKRIERRRREAAAE